MFGFLKRLVGIETIEENALKHSSLGEYNSNNRLSGGGHGQEAINYMRKNNIDYNIVHTYKNGVRVGNVPNHIKKKKRTGDNQSWFPKNWDRKKIKKAGEKVSIGKKFGNGIIKTGKYNNVKIGIIRTDGKIATIFPLNKQD